MKKSSSGGRKSTDGAVGVERVTITMTAHQRRAVKRRGGSPWVRSLIDAAIEANDRPAGCIDPVKRP